MSLVRGVFAVTHTKRRRLLWCAWWTGAPTAEPFRAPDAWAGGAKDLEEARRAAEKAAGMPLEEIEGRWAGAFVRVREGLAPFPERAAKPSDASRPPPPVSPYALLGVASDATEAEVKAAFRQRALAHHPDHGGDPAAFMALKRAYDRVMERRRRR